MTMDNAPEASGVAAIRLTAPPRVQFAGWRDDCPDHRLPSSQNTPGLSRRVDWLSAYLTAGLGCPLSDGYAARGCLPETIVPWSITIMKDIRRLRQMNLASSICAT